VGARSEGDVRGGEVDEGLGNVAKIMGGGNLGQLLKPKGVGKIRAS